MNRRPRRFGGRRSVISIEGIRTIAPPEQHQSDPVEGGLTVGNLGDGDLPFQLDEKDPILTGKQPDQHATDHNQALPSSLKSTSTARAEQHQRSGVIGTHPRADGKQGGPTEGIQQMEVQSAAHHPPDQLLNEQQIENEPSLEDTSDSSDDEYFNTYRTTGRTARDEESMVMARLDADIIRAEEAEIMEKLDLEILQAEEKELMSRIRANIDQAEAQEERDRMPSKVQKVLDVNPVTPFDTDCSWQTLSPWARHHKKRRFSSLKAVEEITSKPRSTANRKITKFLNGQRLFTRGEFYTGVVDPVDQQLRAEDPSHEWRISILEENPKDPDSYLLKYRGPHEAMEPFSKKAEEWIDHRIAHANLQMLLEDEDNILADIVLDSQAPVGAVIHTDRVAIEYSKKHGLPVHGALWVSSAKPGSQLGRIMGFETVATGCAMLAVNGQACKDITSLMTAMAKAKKTGGDMTVTFCLSKFADLSLINRTSLRRRDGNPYDENYYLNLHLQRTLAEQELMQSQIAREEENPWLEYPPEGSPEPTRLPRKAPASEKERLEAMESVLGNDRSVEVDILISAERHIGASFTFDPNANKGGIWAHSITGQLRRIFGTKACALGAVMMKARGVVLGGVEELENLNIEAQSSESPTYRATFVFYDGTDLSDIDRTRLVHGRVNPRRRDGQPYPLHLYPKGKGIADRESTNKKNDQKKPTLAGTERGSTKKRKNTETDEGRMAKKSGSDTRKKPNELKVQATQKEMGHLKNKLQAPKGYEPQKKKTRQVENFHSQDDSEDVQISGNRDGSKPSSESTSPGQTKPGIQNRKVCYDIFKKKYKPLAAIESKGIDGMHLNRVMGSMWAQHKTFLGEDAICDDSCPCLGRIRELSENIISDHCDDQAKKEIHVTKGEVRRMSTGVMSYFAPKFLPLLKTEYPNASPSDLICRLADMWSKHTKQRMYGIRCSEACECDQDRDVFFAGVNRKKPAGAKTGTQKTVKSSSIPRKRRQGLDSDGPSLLSGTQPVTNGAGSRRPSLTEYLPNPAPFAESDSRQRTPNVGTGIKRHLPSGPPTANSHLPGQPAYATKMTVPRKSLASGKETLSKLPNVYSVRFDSSKPLGAYFITETGEAAGKCKVHSVHDKGQVARDIRVQPGTIVQSVIVGMRTNKIQSHSELKKIYDSARTTKSDINILFENSEVRPPQRSNGAFEEDFSFLEKDWSYSGNWQGKVNTGWPGGASLVEELDARALNPQKSNDGKSGLERQARQTRDEDELGRRYEIADVSSDSVPSHRSIRRDMSTSILRSKNHPKKSDNSVKFSEAFVSREFDKEKMASEWIVRKSLSPVVENDRNPSILLSKPETFVDAVKNKSCKDLITVLEQGIASEPEVAETLLDAQYINLRRNVASAQKACDGDPTSEEKRRALKELSAKKVVLNVYLNSSHAIDKAMSLQYWKTFEIRVRSIEIQKSSSSYIRGRSNVLVGKIRTEFRGIQEKLGQLPSRQLSEFVMYSDEDEDVPVFTTSNNAHSMHEKREFVIEIEEGLDSDTTPPSKLGSFRMPLNMIEERCPQDKSVATIKIRNSPSQYLANGEVEICVKRLTVEREYIDSKKRDVQRRIKDQIQNIRLFNQGDGSSLSCTLSGNVQVQQGLSLLHAAVQLQMEDEVTKLLSMGANALSRSSDGTALSLALKLKDRAWEKLKKYMDMGEKRDDIIITKQEGIYQCLERIVQAIKLRKDMVPTSSPGSESTLTHESGSTETHGDLYSDLPSDLARTTSSDSQKSPPPDDSRIWQEVLQAAPNIDGHAPHSAIRKSLTGNMLRKLYPEHFATKESIKAFFQRIIVEGIAVEQGSGGNVILKAPTGQYIDKETSVPTSSNPTSDKTIFLSILRSAPALEGYAPGTAATKAMIGSRLREKFYYQFTDNAKVNDFFDRLVTEGIAIPVGSGNQTGFKLPDADTIPVHAPGLPADLDILRDFFLHTPAVDGYPPGRTARKSVLRTYLRDKYPSHLYDKKSFQEFHERIIARGIVREKSNGTERLLLLNI